MEIRKARMEEMELLLEKYKNARSFMAAHGNPDQWGKNYPPREWWKRMWRREAVMSASMRGVLWVCFIIRKEETGLMM